MKKRLIAKETKIRCQWCLDESTAESWNNTTYAECDSREKRRLYTPIYNPIVFTKNVDVYYKCPLCGEWSRGTLLKVIKNTDNGE